MLRKVGMGLVGLLLCGAVSDTPLRYTPPPVSKQTLRYDIWSLVVPVGNVALQYNTTQERIDATLDFRFNFDVFSNSSFHMESSNGYDSSEDGMRLIAYKFIGGDSSKIEFKDSALSCTGDYAMICGDTRAQNRDPEAFAALVAMMHDPSFPERANAGVFYQGYNGDVHLTYKGKEQVSGVKTKFYDITNVDDVLPDYDVIDERKVWLRVWLQESYPHTLEKAEIQGLPLPITIVRKH